MFCSTVLYCTLSSASLGWKQGKSRCRGNKELSELTAAPHPPPATPFLPLAFPSSPRASSQEPPEMQTYEHARAHTPVRQEGSHPAKSLIHMPRQPLLTRHVGSGTVRRYFFVRGAFRGKKRKEWGSRASDTKFKGLRNWTIHRLCLCVCVNV